MISKNGWTLVHKATQRPVQHSEPCASFRGDISIITGGEPPHKPSSTGRVFILGGNEYYPGVFDLQWVKASV